MNTRELSLFESAIKIDVIVIPKVSFFCNTNGKLSVKSGISPVNCEKQTALSSEEEVKTKNHPCGRDGSDWKFYPDSGYFIFLFAPGIL
jgi:hypothetical protein